MKLKLEARALALSRGKHSNIEKRIQEKRYKKILSESDKTSNSGKRARSKFQSCSSLALGVHPFSPQLFFLSHLMTVVGNGNLYFESEWNGGCDHAGGCFIISNCGICHFMFPFLEAFSYSLIEVRHVSVIL